MPSGLEWIDRTDPMTTLGLLKKAPNPLFLMSRNSVSTKPGLAHSQPERAET